MRKFLLFLFLLSFSTTQIDAQAFPKRELKAKLKADRIEMDEGNGDGVFKARSKKTHKWGMYQWMYSGTNVKMLIPMEYDSVRYFPFNGSFTAVYNDGKVGIYHCEWSFGDEAKQTIECKYEGYRRVNVRKDKYSSPSLYLAMKKNGKWGWVDWMTGEEKSEFIYDTIKDLPYPEYAQ